MDPDPVRTFGQARLLDGTWFIKCEPHVALRAKRVFSKLDKLEVGVFRLSCNEENCRDLEWFLDRYPMDLRPEDRKALSSQARAHDRRMANIGEILKGRYTVPLKTPMAKPPRSYQLEDAAILWSMGGLLIGSELGTGKTVSFLTMLTDPKCLPAVIVCPVQIQKQWKDKAAEFVPTLRTHIVKRCAHYEVDPLPDLWIITYAKLASWARYLAKDVRIRLVGYDECQELRRNGTERYQAAQVLSTEAEYRCGCSGTPIFNYGIEFHTVFDCIAPGQLGTRAEFIREWCTQTGGYYGSDDKACIKDPKAFGSHLLESGRMVVRTKKDIGRELPALTNIVHEVESDPKALTDIKSAATELAKYILDGPKNNRFELMQASAEFANKIRQATGISKAPFVSSFIDMLLRGADEKVLVCAWHREVHAIIEDRLRDWGVVMFTGSESANKKQKSLEAFIDGPARVLLMSLRSGAGIDGIQKRCSRIVFAELDWAYGVHEQATGRVYRDGQTEPVFAYYLVANDGADPTIMDALGVKKNQLKGVIDPASKMVAPKLDPDHVKKLAQHYLGRTK